MNLVARCQTAGEGNRQDGESVNLLPVVAKCLNAGRDGYNDGSDQTYLPVPLDMRQLSRGDKFTNNRTDGGPPGTGIGKVGEPSATIAGSHVPAVSSRYGVRRLTPRECERLQGFPDDWTRYAADGSELSDSARYRMLGNAVAVPVVEWILKRIHSMGRRVIAAAGLENSP